MHTEYDRVVFVVLQYVMSGIGGQNGADNVKNEVFYFTDSTSQSLRIPTEVSLVL
ncbi:uncharacterized protein PHALS_00283 [Plasmopara halstedii]|uniref:Uncharacterized protein n=1 Tax=Plasmopara halstedii TaxID=4781 RepID=A0A0P1A6X3_PLAHL|nr:uncharacterized protein PHALS_00283 [Plasmopara halstedii]CEG35960.1 hypothetical protein PHALS_00283 [Plasmopara halstedii]|eukprot:XP_024572329.1 hypothetical protein PHALS_00283 [Plasmopara halstedii]